MLRTSINRAAVGRSGKIGALYDVRSDTFTHDSLFTRDLDDDSIESMEHGETSIEIVRSDNTEDKFHALNIEAALQISLLAGLVKLKGSGAYISNEKKSARAQRMTLMYKVTTQIEEISLRQHKRNFDNDVLMAIKNNSLEATHVVVGIDWGAVCSITCESENSEDREETAVKGELGVELEKFKTLLSAGGTGKADYSDSSQHKGASFTFKCNSDVSPVDKTLPFTFEEALSYAKNLPVCIQHTNGGKGVPLLFTLVSLDSVVKMCCLQINLQLNFRFIEEDAIKRTVQIAEEITAQKQRLHDVQKDLHKLGDYVEEAAIVRIDQYVNDIAVQEASFRCKLRELVAKIRRQEVEVSSLETLVKEFVITMSSYDTKIQGFQASLKHLKLVKAWLTRGIRYTDKKTPFFTDDAAKVYILYKPRATTKKGQQMESYFLRCHGSYKEHDDTIFKVVDEAIRPDLWPSERQEATIVLFENGSMTSDDLYTRDGRNMNMCLIRHHNLQRGTKSTDSAPVKLRCPKKCSGKAVIWECSECKEVVEFGIKTRRFHCSCGSSAPTTVSFRCNEESHGIEYVKYPENLLFDQLNQLRAIPEKNILILGEIGVGKSTWINGIVNYLAFKDLQDAMNASTFYTLIPSQFTQQVGDKSVEVKLGGGSNNSQSRGRSETKEARAYVFFFGEEKIRLIDTPGVGLDVEGDKKSLENILSYVSFYDEIHAVCILLKSNNSRVTVSFSYCLQELLKSLHKSAKSNVVFCFTNSRGAGFAPGDTITVLNRTLNDMSLDVKCSPSNYFCFDNEAVRFLACVQSNIFFPEKRVHDFAESWEFSANETFRFFHKIQSMDPHQVKSTISINESRKIIIAMTKPLAEIAKAIQQNVQIAHSARDRVDFQTHTLTEQKKALRFKGIDLEREELPFPMTVCAHPNCIKRVTVGEENRQEILYEQVCHCPCKLQGVPTETINDYRLQDCRCIEMYGTNCIECSHDFKIHMHITYTFKKVETEFISREVQHQILEMESKKEQGEAFKKTIDNKIRELREEESCIIKACAQYGAFLKQNAVRAYNDATGGYLDFMIEQEETSELVDKELTERLRRLKREYFAEKRLIEEAMSRGVKITPEEILEVKTKLFRLKRFGSTLERILDGISISHSTKGMCYQETIAPIRQRTSASASYPPRMEPFNTDTACQEASFAPITPANGAFYTNRSHDDASIKVSTVQVPAASSNSGTSDIGETGWQQNFNNSDQQNTSNESPLRPKVRSSDPLPPTNLVTTTAETRLTASQDAGTNTARDVSSDDDTLLPAMPSTPPSGGELPHSFEESASESEADDDDVDGLAREVYRQACILM